MGLSEIVVWWMKRFAAPYLMIWLAAFVVVFVFTSTSPLSFNTYATIASAIVLLLALVFFPLWLYSFYSGRIRKAFQALRLLPGFEDQATCKICGDKLVEAREFGNFLRLPNWFLDLRHYEKNHHAIAGDARRARRSIILQAHFIVFGLAALIAFDSVTMPGAGLVGPIQTTLAFLTTTLFLGLLGWAIMWVLVRRRRGSKA